MWEDKETIVYGLGMFLMGAATALMIWGFAS